MSFPGHDTTALLLAARAGRREATDALFAHLYDELRDLARLRLSRHRPGATIETTGLVHEAYLKLVDRKHVTISDRAHFLAIAARAMRYVLLDRARARNRLKRRGPRSGVSPEPVVLAADQRALDLLVLDEALERLRAHSPRLAEVVEYRFFGGLTYTDIAEVTGRSVATVERDWVRARLWLYDALDDRNGDAAAPGREGGVRRTAEAHANDAPTGRRQTSEWP